MKLWIFIAILTLSFPAGAYKATSPVGYWLADKKRDIVVDIKPCGDTYCGRVAWVSEKKNLKNPELCNALVLEGMKAEGTQDAVWSGGQLHKVDDGQHYAARLKLVDSSTLEVRGFVGIPALGKSYQFKKVNAQSYPDCKTAFK